ncbi:SIR2 family protein [Rhizobium ruizarguesonis]|nr:SIR2 family protein [Rhizobium ruizarguesonis]
MRFVAEGPSIPDELLVARDDGRVIFFCGAGVSRARTGLPDFFGLAEAVIAELGVSSQSPVHRILEEARNIETRTGVAGLISADKLFGLLEQDFSRKDIEAAVAKSLKPKNGADTSAHRILVDLATAPNGNVQLVTTNFDRLFNDCRAAISSTLFPNLPDPARQGAINGIIYLHGRATLDYRGAENDGFVLSSASFGKAYLSDGWAANFFKEILKRFVVVFVGYTADDPPVQYLLEALNSDGGYLEGVYAFQSGTEDAAIRRWRHKGVRAIPYDPAESHKALWDTLEAWAARANDIDGWYSAILRKAQKGPDKLAPHERGQVAHVVGTVEGIRRFAAVQSLPAEWLCSFDPSIRYGKPGTTGNSYRKSGPYVDPFDLYGLDFDDVPKKIEQGNFYAKRDVPKTAWSAFEPSAEDRLAVGGDASSSFRGQLSTLPVRLPPRLDVLAVWFGKISHTPAAIWWAAKQLGLHPSLIEEVRWRLKDQESAAGDDVRTAWSFLFEAWQHDPHRSRRAAYELQEVKKARGWDRGAIRQLSGHARPYLTAKPSYSSSPIPPVGKHLRLRELVHVDVEYPDIAAFNDVPAELKTHVLRECRRNLEIAVDLETEIGGYGLNHISPIIPDDDPEIDRYSRSRGLSRLLHSYVSMLSGLTEVNPNACRHEIDAWPTNDDTVFARLRIWALGNKSLVPESEFLPLLQKISRDAFWFSDHQRDLLLSLASRWNALGITQRKELERRLIQGPKRWRREKTQQYVERKNGEIATRIRWIATNTTGFTFDAETFVAKIRLKAPRWEPDWANSAVNSREGQSGTVRTDTDIEVLKDVPASELLKEAKNASGRSSFLVEKDPFAGLSNSRPLKSLAALNDAAKKGDFPAWAWSRFLESSARKDDDPALIRLIANRLVSYPIGPLSELIRPISSWFETVSETLAAADISLFDKTFEHLISILRFAPEQAGSSIVRGDEEPDWTMEAINSPVGRIAQAILADPRKEGLDWHQGLPAIWRKHSADLISLGGDLRRHALVIFGHQTNWLFAVDPKWTQATVLNVLDGGDVSDQNALWAGFFWAATVPNTDLYVQLKPHLLRRATERRSVRRNYNEIIAGMLMAGWASFDSSGNRLVSSEELRDLLTSTDDELRSHVIWQIERWSEEATKAGPDPDQNWSRLLIPFLKEVWPKQKSVKSPLVSARLCDLAFSRRDDFEKVVDTILPLVSKVEGDQVFLPILTRSDKSVVDENPGKTLELLYAVLPDNVRAWPHGTEGVLKRIQDAEPLLRTDIRLLELLRRIELR